ncbi:MAG: GNAT family N-acetyltransferase [Syntrophobacterales bacterium]|jgi:ribosomal-protein-alanine N-acetyltransferase
MRTNSQDHSEIIRSATEQDFDQVMEIDRLSFSDPWIYNFFKSSLGDIFLVLEKGREICGYLVACECQDVKKAVILRVAVHPDHRGEGAGRRLIIKCFDILVERNIGVVELDVELVSRGAIKLYERLGFKIANIMVFPSDYPGDEETFYVMRLELPKPGLETNNKQPMPNNSAA